MDFLITGNGNSPFDDRIPEIQAELHKAEELFIHCKTKEAFPLFEKLAYSGNGRAMYFLGDYYDSGEYGVPEDEEAAIYWWKKGAAAGDPLAKLNLFQKLDPDGPETDRVIGELFPVLIQLANDGDVIAQNELAELYLGDYPREENRELGLYWLKLSAQAGYFYSQFELFCRYVEGIGVEQDPAEAVIWCRKAAEQGLAVAQFNLGGCYYEGVGVERDYSEALKWFRLSAEQENAQAYIYLGNCYYYGNGIEQDYNEAVKWYKKSARKRYFPAYNNLGNCYFHGNGVKFDLAEAARLYRIAAEHDDKIAQDQLSDCYFYGLGVERDYTKSEKWFRKADGDAGGMYLKLDLDGFIVDLRIRRYRKTSKNDWDDVWCKTDFSFVFEPYFNYSKNNYEVLLAFEIDEMVETFEALVSGQISERTVLEFIEPDFCFILNPDNESVVDNGSDSQYNAYVAMEWRIAFWNDGLTSNHLSLYLDRDDITALLTYLKIVSGRLSADAPEVNELIGKKIFKF